MQHTETFIHHTSVVDEGAIIGGGCKIWHFSHIYAGAVIGEGCNIGQNVMVASDVILGKNVKVQNNVSIYSGVVCEDNVFLGPSCVFTNVRTPRSEFPRHNRFEKTTVGQGATVGANATIVCGVKIGQYAFIGAGAVVTRTVPDYALVSGNPARQTGWVSRHGCRLRFDNDGMAVCPESGISYRLLNNHIYVE